MLRTPRSTMLRTAAATALVAAGLVGSASPGVAAPPTCFGKPATIVGTVGADRITGTPGRDVIVSLAGDDEIDGGAGRDRICAGTGDDLVRGGAEGDRMGAGAGADEVRGQGGADLLLGGADTPGDGTASRGDLLVGGTGDDRTFGDLRTEPADPSAYNDTDSVSFEDAGVAIRSADVAPVETLEGGVVRVGGQTDRVHGIHRIIGTSFDDVLRAVGTESVGPILAGGEGDDVLDGVESYGGPGDDRLIGERYPRGYGAFLVGGPGADTMTSPGTQAVLLGGPGADVGTTTGGGAELDGGPGADRLEARQDALMLGGDGADRIVGSPQSDYLYVAGGDVVRAGDGFDIVRLTDRTVPAVMDGGGGVDRLNAADLITREGGQEVDTARVMMDFVTSRLTYRGTTSVARSFDEYYGPMLQPNYVIGSPDDEIIWTGCRTDRIFAGGGDDSLRPMRGDDLVDAGNGDDRINDDLVFYACSPYDRTDDDRVDGGPGTDRLIVAGAALEGGGDGPTRTRTADLGAGYSDVRGDDRLADIENLTGTVFGDVLRGDDGPNVIDGGQGGGDDRLYGLGGDDRVVTAGADRGDNLADGGAGDDTCRARTMVRCETELGD